MTGFASLCADTLALSRRVSALPSAGTLAGLIAAFGLITATVLVLAVTFTRQG